MGDLPDKLIHAMSMIDKVVRIPAYRVWGALSGGRLLIKEYHDTYYDVYVYDNGELIKLNKGLVNSLPEPPYGADRVVMVVRDDSSIPSPVIVRVDDPDEEVPLSPYLPPMMIYSVVDKGEKVYILGYDGYLKIYEVVPHGEVREAVTLSFTGMPLDVGRRYGVGIVRGIDALRRFFVFDVVGGETRLLRTGGEAVAAVMAPDDTMIAAVSSFDEIRLLRASPPDWSPAPMDLGGSDITEYEPTSIEYLGLTPEGELVVVASKHGRSGLFVDGKRVETPAGILGPAYKVGDHFVVTHASLKTPPRVIKVAPGEGWEPLIEPDLPREVAESLGEAGFVWVSGAGGVRVPTFYLESRRAGRPGPAVVLVHGGPSANYSDAWYPEVAVLAYSGFHVLMPNYRGSTGFGPLWELGLVGRVCDAEVSDVVAAADWARRSGLSSEEYVMGYSYGGYVTLCVMTKHPRRFAAGVAGACFTDYEEKYYKGNIERRAHIRMMLLLHGEDGRESVRKLREASPINYVARLRRPVCIIHSPEDKHVPPHSALRFVEEAMKKGKEVELHIVPGLRHGLATNEELIRYLYPAISFLIRQRERQGIKRGKGLTGLLRRVKHLIKPPRAR